MSIVTTGRVQWFDEKCFYDKKFILAPHCGQQSGQTHIIVHPNTLSSFHVFPKYKIRDFGLTRSRRFHAKIPSFLIGSPIK